MTHHDADILRTFLDIIYNGNIWHTWTDAFREIGIHYDPNTIRDCREYGYKGRTILDTNELLDSKPMSDYHFEILSQFFDEDMALNIQKCLIQAL
jgi:hypothetical protein